MGVQPTAPPVVGKDAKCSFPFSDQSVRSRFVAKVFTLVTIMFTIVTIMCAMPIIIPSFKDWIEQSVVFFSVSLGVFLVTGLILLCCSSVRRSYPLNLIAMNIFTLAGGCMTLATTSTYNVYVLIALCITTGLSAAIILFAITMKKDLTTLVGIIYIFGMTMMLLFCITATISVLAFQVTFLYIIYAACGALLVILFLAIDVQLIMAGRRYELLSEEYIFASMQIFLDFLIVSFFPYALVCKCPSK